MTYEYDPKRYFIQVVFTGWFSVAIAVACLLMASPLFSVFPPLMLVFAFVAVYSAFGIFVSHSYPRAVRVFDDRLEFESFGRCDTFALADIKEFAVREMPHDGAYVRINGGSLLRGRYWVYGEYMSEGHDLATKLTALEIKMNPEGLKALSRKHHGKKSKNSTR